MQGFEQVLRAVAFVETHLTEAVTVANLADAAGCSLYHFCRIFNGWSGHSPYDYLIRRRLTEAAREIVGSARKLIDIGLDYQFNNPETFSRAFKRMFGVPPQQYRSHGVLDPRFLREPLTPEILELASLQPSAVKPAAIPGRCICGLGAWIPRTTEAIQALWSRAHAEAAPHAVPAAMAYGMVYYPPDWPARGVFYLAGWEENELRGEGPAWVRKSLPASAGWCMPVTGWPQAEPAWAHLYQTVLPLSGVRPGDYEWHVVGGLGTMTLQVPTIP